MAETMTCLLRYSNPWTNAKNRCTQSTGFPWGNEVCCIKEESVEEKNLSLVKCLGLCSIPFWRSCWVIFNYLSFGHQFSSRHRVSLELQIKSQYKRSNLLKYTIMHTIMTRIQFCIYSPGWQRVWHTGHTWQKLHICGEGRE